jgi:hypothetical protein
VPRYELNLADLPEENYDFYAYPEDQFFFNG